MKFKSFMIFGLLGLSACGEYKGLQANCFDGGSSGGAVVTRSANSMTFLSQSNDGVASSKVSVSDCQFTTLGGPLDAGTK